jgi:hypothetical protein
VSSEKVTEIVRAELASFVVPRPVGALGVSWSHERWASEIALLRRSLVEPRLAAVHIPDARERPDAFLGVKQLWLVTSTVENSCLIVFDREISRFGLAVDAAQQIETVGIWGDLVSTFCAR